MGELKYPPRFDRIGRLVGEQKLKKLMGSSVMVIGLGGVGSWAAESLVRSGIGRVTLIDFDEVCITNTNRQLQALAPNSGKPKAEVLAERLREINPEATIHSVVRFYDAESSGVLLKSADGAAPDYIIDAIDHVTAKCHLLNECRMQGIPVVCSTGAGGRLDPTRIQVKDLAESEVDPLAKVLRRILRQQYGFPETGAFGISSVYSMEEARAPIGFQQEQGGKVVLGTSSFVTATFGMVCASVVVRKIIGEM